MWNAAERVEESPWSGEERRGLVEWIPSLGYSGKEGVTFLFVCVMGWRIWLGMGCAGSSGVTHSHIAFAAVGAGLSERTRAGKKNLSCRLKSAGLGVERGRRCASYQMQWSEARLHRLNEWALGGGTLTDTENWGINKTVFLFFFFIKKGVVNRDENQEASIRYTKRG